MLPLLQRPSLKDLLRHTREAVVCEMDLSHQRVMRDGGVLRIQPLQARKMISKTCFTMGMCSSLLTEAFCEPGVLLCCLCIGHP